MLPGLCLLRSQSPPRRASGSTSATSDVITSTLFLSVRRRRVFARLARRKPPADYNLFCASNLVCNSHWSLRLPTKILSDCLDPLDRLRSESTISFYFPSSCFQWERRLILDSLLLRSIRIRVVSDKFIAFVEYRDRSDGSYSSLNLRRTKR